MNIAHAHLWFPSTNEVDGDVHIGLVADLSITEKTDRPDGKAKVAPLI